LKDDPQSAWALYERFHTERTMRMQKEGANALGTMESWPATRAKILESNPLYRSMGQAQGQEGLFDLTRRMELQELFKDRGSTAKDVITTADIALDLEAFDMAGLLYWSIVSAFDPKQYDDRPLLESFLYCLERLGVKEIKSNFQGDHKAAFAAIEADRRKRVAAAFQPSKPDAAKSKAKPTPAKP
jgi:hypothetical protein